tara:strand:+ start:9385 stop:9486 length:102 start_codon:yes stop_codon:yes gene_type:complete
MSYYAYILKMLFHFMDLDDLAITEGARKNSLDE